MRACDRIACIFHLSSHSSCPEPLQVSVVRGVPLVPVRVDDQVGGEVDLREVVMHLLPQGEGEVVMAESRKIVFDKSTRGTLFYPFIVLIFLNLGWFALLYMENDLR